MPRGHRTDEFETDPTEAFAAAHDQIIQGGGKGRRRLVARAGIEGRGFKFPAREAGGGGGDFEFRHGIVQFAAIEAVDGLHGQVRPLHLAAGDSGAIPAFGAFKQVGPAHGL